MRDSTDPRRRFVRVSACGTALVLGLSLCALGGCGGCGASATPREARPNVFIYLVDTLRPDHLGLYGYERDTAPELDVFAEDAVVFERAYTPASWTKPAAASLLSGLMPQKHGAVTLSSRIPGDVQLLSEHLRELGYSTAAFVNNVNVIETWGFDQGFDHFDDVKQRTRSSDAEGIVRSALDWLSGAGSGPFFVYLHTIDPHGIYNPPRPFRYRWSPDDKRLAVNPLELTENTPADALMRTIASYDGEIAYNDHWFGKLLEALRARKLYEDSLVFFLSDHGEEFLEHGQGAHAHTLYEELVRIPLVVKFPGSSRAGTRVTQAASLLDVLPTVLSTLGQPLPAHLDGVDLAALGAGSAPSDAVRRPLLFGLDIKRHPPEGSDAVEEPTHILEAILHEDYKLILRTEPVREEQLFDLAADPGERDNLVTSHPDQAELLRGMLTLGGMRGMSGIHLRVVNEPGQAETVFTGTLSTSGRFVEVEGHHLEEQDSFAVREKGKRIAFRMFGRNIQDPKAPRQQLTDEDLLFFRLDPPTAGFRLERFERAASGRARVFLGKDRLPSGPLPLELQANDARLLVGDEGDLRRTSAEASLPAGGYLSSVPEPDGEHVDMDAETLERLRALGYVK